MNKQIKDLPSSPAATGLEATDVKVTPDGITDLMIANLKNYCIKNFNGKGDVIFSNVRFWLLKNKDYAARQPNPKACLQLIAKRNYWKMMKEEKRFVPLETVSSKALRQVGEENNHEKEDERIEQIFNLASPSLQKAIKYVLLGDSFGEAAGKIGMSESQLCQHLARLGGRNKQYQPELFWEKAG